MATETRPLPPLAKSAFELLMREFDTRAAVLGQQVVDMLGLRERDNWIVDFTRGEIRRDVPDAPSPDPSPRVQRRPRARHRKRRR